MHYNFHLSAWSEGLNKDMPESFSISLKYICKFLKRQMKTSAKVAINKISTSYFQKWIERTDFINLIKRTKLVILNLKYWCTRFAQQCYLWWIDHIINSIYSSSSSKMFCCWFHIVTDIGLLKIKVCSLFNHASNFFYVPLLKYM